MKRTEGLSMKTLRPRPPGLPGLEGPLCSSSSPAPPWGEGFCRPGGMYQLKLVNVPPSTPRSGDPAPQIPCPNNPQQHPGPVQAPPQSPTGSGRSSSKGWTLGERWPRLGLSAWAVHRLETISLSVWDGTRGGRWSGLVSRAGPLSECLSWSWKRGDGLVIGQSGRRQ